jgi:hypothetical protein
MINYTLEDAKALAVEVANYYKDNEISTWLDIIDTGMKEFANDIKEVILDLLGPYTFSFTREFSKKIGLTDLVFETPVKMMPVYIESENPWETVVARWRLSIQK